MVQLVNGMRDVQRGFAALRAHPGLWKWVLAPAAITLVLFVGLIIGVMHLIDPLVGWMLAHLPSWLANAAGSIARSLLTTVVVVALSIGALFVFVSVAGMLAGPFNEVLSEHLEAGITGKPSTPFAFGELVRGFVVGIAHGLRRLLSSLIGLALIFALGFIPVVGTIAAALIGAWIAASGAAYDCYDAVLSRRSLSYRDKAAYLARYRPRSLGLGAAVTGMLLVPGVNLIALGLGAAGATLAVLEHDGAMAQRSAARMSAR